MNEKIKKHKNERKKTNTHVYEILVNQKQKFGADETKIRNYKSLNFCCPSNTKTTISVLILSSYPCDYSTISCLNVVSQ